MSTSTDLAIRPDARTIQELHMLIKDVCSIDKQQTVRSKINVEHDDGGRLWYSAWVLHGDYLNVFTGTWICIGGSDTLQGLSRFVRNR